MAKAEHSFCFLTEELVGMIKKVMKATEVLTPPGKIAPSPHAFESF